MMMGPGNFIEMELRGKSKEEALKAIKDLRKEMDRLKKVIEEEPESEEMMICPSPDVKISVYRDYLAAARDYFEEQGWEYKPSKEETADKEFNDRLRNVQSIMVEYGGFLCGGETRKITFNGDKILVDRNYRMAVPDIDELDREFYKDMVKDDLLEGLAGIHMGEWKKEYDDPCVLDGIQWSIVIRYTDGRKKVFEGSNSYPPGFYDFLDIMQIDVIDA